jgi:hypothetical protein
MTYLHFNLEMMKFQNGMRKFKHVVYNGIKLKN